MLNKTEINLIQNKENLFNHLSYSLSTEKKKGTRLFPDTCSLLYSFQRPQIKWFPIAKDTCHHLNPEKITKPLNSWPLLSSVQLLSAALWHKDPLIPNYPLLYYNNAHLSHLLNKYMSTCTPRCGLLGELWRKEADSYWHLLCVHIALPLSNMLVPVILKGVLGNESYNPHVYKWSLRGANLPKVMQLTKQSSQDSHLAELRAWQLKHLEVHMCHDT